ncbi:hypothetical protein EYC59_01570 [Candidatus Saccharibacteria bacterium]|nr:MAG: hypothetical protein EYC59_01570 [Candidatus Saccharibacteria bacterium]
MNAYTKYRATRLASLLAVLVMVYCFYRVVPAGMGGEIQSVKLWIGVAFVATSVGIACALAMYYYRAVLQRGETERAATATLGKAGAKQSQSSKVAVQKGRQKSV